MCRKSKCIKRLMFSYVGSKWNLSKKYVPLFPQHKIYLCPFLGTGAEFALKEPSRREIINDIDHNIYAVFYVLRDEQLFRRLLYLLENSHDARRLYEECHDRLKTDDLSLLERAYCFLICGNQGFRRRHPVKSKSYASAIDKAVTQKTLLETVLAWRNRMRNVEVENIDAIDLLDRYDNPDVFAFLDPPYHHDVSHKRLYLHDDFDHRRLVKRIQTFKGKVFLCGYEHGLYDIQLLGWRKHTIQASKSVGGKAPRTEVVWMNYDEDGNKITQDLELVRGFEELPV